MVINQDGRLRLIEWGFDCVQAFEERMLPEVKADYPGLKLSQYKEKIFDIWKKSPENPLNQRRDV